MWGGRLPTWEEFLAASKRGRVGINKTVAAQAIHMKGMPKAYGVAYGIVILWCAFLLIPSVIIAWLFMEFSSWWILVSVFVAFFLVRVSREGHCEGLSRAKRNTRCLSIAEPLCLSLMEGVEILTEDPSGKAVNRGKEGAFGKILQTSLSERGMR